MLDSRPFPAQQLDTLTVSTLERTPESRASLLDAMLPKAARRLRPVLPGGNAALGHGLRNARRALLCRPSGVLITTLAVVWARIVVATTTNATHATAAASHHQDDERRDDREIRKIAPVHVTSP